LDRRVAITGIGLVTPLGVGLQPTWEALTAGTSGAGPITQFDPTGFATTFACEVKGFDPATRLDKRLSKTLDRFLQMGLVAALEAAEDAGLEFGEQEAERVGVYVGSGIGGLQSIERAHESLLERGPRRALSPYFIPSILINLAAGQISILLGARGPSVAHVSACTSSAHSIGEALRVIQRGDADVMLAGGSEASVTSLAIGGFNAMRALSTRNDEPTRASRPFDAGRDGFVVGEGAGVLVLEEAQRATRRRARIYAELAGYGANSDAHHITAPSPDGVGARRCMALALRDGGVSPEAVGHINAHGTSTRFNDPIETRAIKDLFGAHAAALAICSTKSMTGHLLGAAGGVETAFSALAVFHGLLPPTINYEVPDPECDLDYTPNVAREVVVEAALSNSFGFGGTNASLLLRRW
jgi:3-oxoacyl-[acyl-carrier-protein] synthase II